MSQPNIPNHFVESFFWERLRHYVPTEFIGKKVDSLEELAELDSKFKDVDLLWKKEDTMGLPGFEVYGVTEGDFSIPLAYRCGSCKQIMIDKPDYKDFDNIRPLGGSKGYKADCTNCDTTMYRNILMFSYQ